MFEVQRGGSRRPASERGTGARRRSRTSTIASTALAGHGRLRIRLVAGLAIHGQPAALEPHDRALLHAEERPAAKALTLLGRLEEERGALAAQLEVSRHGRLAVVDEAAAEGDQR